MLICASDLGLRRRRFAIAVDEIHQNLDADLPQPGQLRTLDDLRAELFDTLLPFLEFGVVGHNRYTIN